MTVFMITSMILMTQCNLGPGTSSRDACKDFKDGGYFRPSQPSRAEAFGGNCARYLATYNPNDKSVSDPLLMLCVLAYNDLKECDNRSKYPMPIPIK